MGGQCIPEFEAPPEAWTRRYWNWLAIVELEADSWSNQPLPCGITPYGAGMCVRRSVAEHYRVVAASDPVRLTFDRTGKSLAGGGDADMALSGRALGLGSGLFKNLKLIHIMPPTRLQEPYLLALVEAMTRSSTVLRFIYGIPPIRPSRSQRLLKWYQARFVSAREQRFDRARARGFDSACQEIARIANAAATEHHK